MATVENNYQIQQRVAEDEFIILHPETVADNVLVNVEGLTAKDLNTALTEINNEVEEIVAGGVVTGVKGNSETTYRKGDVNITAGDIGLGNVNNTADKDKPVSTAQQTALDKKANTADLGDLAFLDIATPAQVGLGNVTNDAQVKRTEMGVANGVATLDSGGRVPASQLPAYVDDVITKDTLADFPIPGEDDKLYVTRDTNLTYRWSGEAYIAVSVSLALGETSSTAYPGNKGKANADAITALQTRATNIEAKNTSQDTAITRAQTTANTAVENAAAAQSTADSANTKATTNATNIANIVSGTTKVPSASTADIATKLAAARTISVTGAATGSTTFDGSANASISLTLANSGITPGTYSAIAFNAKGIATAGSQLIEIGAEGQSDPTAGLAIGGLFFKRI